MTRNQNNDMIFSKTEDDIRISKKTEAEIEQVLGRGLRRFGLYAVGLITFVLLVFASITMMKAKFFVGIIMLVVVIFGSSILLGIHLEKTSKKKIEKYSDSEVDQCE